MQTVGALLVVLGASGWGCYAVFLKQKQIRQLSFFITSLELLQRNLVHHLMPLPQLLEMVSSQAQGDAKVFFTNCQKEIENGNAVSESWQKSVQLMTHHGQTFCQSMLPLAQFLGKFEADMQAQHISYTLEQLKKQYDESKAQCLKTGKVYRALGVTVGIFIVVILL